MPWRTAVDAALVAGLARFAPRDLRALDHLGVDRRLSALRTLSLARCGERATAPPLPLVPSSAATLTALDLSDCFFVTADWLRRLFRSGALQALHTRSLSRCVGAGLDDDDHGLAGYALLPLAPQLRELRLDRCGVTPLSLFRLAPALTALHVLSLDRGRAAPPPRRATWCLTVRACALRCASSDAPPRCANWT